MRAPGTAPGTFALESAFDEAAERLGIDPVELRMRNFADQDQESGRPWSSNSLLEADPVAAERLGGSPGPQPRPPPPPPLLPPSATPHTLCPATPTPRHS